MIVNVRNAGRHVGTPETLGESAMGAEITNRMIDMSDDWLNLGDPEWLSPGDPRWLSLGDR